MKQRKAIITALVCTIICVIICTCILVVIKNNKKTDIESENSDYVYGASVENYNNMIDNLRTADKYNLGVIRVIAVQDGRIGRTYKYSEGIGGLYESSCPPTRGVVENVNKNLGLTGDDRLSVEDVVNNENKSLSGSDKIRKADEEICKMIDESDGDSYNDYYDAVLELE